MTTTTSNYGLFKYVSSSDANLAFNITSALNNNWDKLDTYAVRRSSTGSVGTTQTPVYVNSSGVVTACSYSIPTSTGLTATVSLSENGYIKFSNSWKVVWGEGAARSSKNGIDKTITFSSSFTTKALSIAGSPEAQQISMFLVLKDLTTANFVARSRDNSSSGYDFNFHYIAVGY